MTMNAIFLSEKFSAAHPYEAYVRTGTEEQQRRWRQVYDLRGSAPRKRNSPADLVET